MEASSEILLHPELLSNEQLVQIISERHLKIPNISLMPRSDLLEVFHQYCVPYGQRKHRDSGRGKLLNKTRCIRQDCQPKLNVNFHNENTRKTCNDINSERLKPPPDLLSGHMKRIKIENSSTNVNTNVNSGYKRNLSLENSQMISPPPAKKERKLITWP